jgi:ring-1,2-phenylacetyl-CoA epoxidase subunit PaaC
MPTDPDPRHAMTLDRQLFDYLLRLGDSPLILAQRLGEWVGKGPIIEEDMALTNVGLDLLGQARLWLGYAGEVEARFAPPGRDEDQLAFLRDAGAFRNLLIAEQPNGDFADTTARQFLFDAWHVLVLQALGQSKDARIAEIAAKGAKEAAYHVERSGDWVIRLGDGTDESHARMQAAVDELWMYTGEMFVPDATELALIEAGLAADVRTLAAPWRQHVDAVFAEARLAAPEAAYMQKGGKQGVHTEHLGHLLAEMQFLQRAYPGARW